MATTQRSRSISSRWSKQATRAGFICFQLWSYFRSLKAGSQYWTACSEAAPMEFSGRVEAALVQTCKVVQRM